MLKNIFFNFHQLLRSFTWGENGLLRLLRAIGEYGIAGCWYRAYTGRPLECLTFEGSEIFLISSSVQQLPIKSNADVKHNNLGHYLLLHNLPWAELCRDLKKKTCLKPIWLKDKPIEGDGSALRRDERGWRLRRWAKSCCSGDVTATTTERGKLTKKELFLQKPWVLLPPLLAISSSTW